MLQQTLESSGLDIFAQIGLVVFVIGFLAVVLRIWLLDDDRAREHAGLPLDETDHADDAR